MSPHEILHQLRPHVAHVQKATVPQDVPPELERELAALRALHRKVIALTKIYDEGWKGY